MDEQEWLRRIDEHLDDIKRSNETAKDHMREGNELMARIDATLERNQEAIERNSEAIERNSEVITRNTDAFMDLSGFLQQVATVLGAMTAELRQGRDAFVEETRAQRRALFAILDRLENGPRPSGA
jgi:methyl-accepting chemotaxis protein